jgi:hypothetical protein
MDQIKENLTIHKAQATVQTTHIVQKIQLVLQILLKMLQDHLLTKVATIDLIPQIMVANAHHLTKVADLLIHKVAAKDLTHQTTTAVKDLMDHAVVMVAADHTVLKVDLVADVVDVVLQANL